MWLLWMFMSLAFATDMSGVWQANDSTVLLIPFMRDGDIPLIVKKGKSEAVLWGRWSMEKESLTITIPNGETWILNRGGNEDQLLFQKGNEDLELQRRSSFQKRPSDGIWTTKSQGEFIPVIVGSKTYVIHQTPSQKTKLYKGKLVKGKEDSSFHFKAKKKCFVSFPKKTPEKAVVTCGRYIHEWEQYYKPVEIPDLELNGIWIFENTLFHIKMDRFQWETANLEYENIIHEYKGKWAAGSMGTKFYLEKSGLPNVVGTYAPQAPDQLILTIEGKMMIFTRKEGF